MAVRITLYDHEKNLLEKVCIGGGDTETVREELKSFEKNENAGFALVEIRKMGARHSMGLDSEHIEMFPSWRKKQNQEKNLIS